MSEYCLGLEFLGNCKYLPDQPSWRIISIGDTITTIALLMTFTQLLSLTKKETIYHALKNSYLFWIGAVLLIIISSILPILPGEAIPILGYPIAWEFCAAILLIGVITYVIIKYRSPLKFSPRTAKSTIGSVTRIIARGDSKDHAELAEHLTPAVPDIIDWLQKHSNFKEYLAKEEGIEYKIEETTSDAIHLIRVLADPFFCSSLVQREPGFIIRLFHDIAGSNLSGEVTRPFVWEIVKQALANKSSILFRERSYSGLGLRKEFLNSTFSNCEFTEKTYPLSHWFPLLNKDMDDETFQAFADCFLMICDSYFSQQRFYEHSFIIQAPGNTIAEFPRSAIYSIDKISKDEVYSSPACSYLQISCATIKKLITKTLESSLANDNSYHEYISKIDNKKDCTIINKISEWSYELLESASYTRIHDFVLRSSLIELWLAIYPIGEEDHILLKEIRKRFELKIMAQLKVNFEEGLYPAISRPVITTLGLYYMQDEKPESQFRRQVLDYLKDNFLALYRQNKEQALDKLPSNIIFKEEENCLVQTIYKGNIRKILLNGNIA
ncbi:MAG: hypothetical protein HQK50_07200 [Oligoflexia bacterium]|nr:hypothetical protein [Oligoflexia bacterium]MBF0365340.1 hypothetical protein [Oligoflexia bacterium]